MTFERFTSNKKGRVPKLSVRKNGQLSLNASAMLDFFGQHKYVTLFYDRETSSIGVKGCSAEDVGAYKLTIIKHGAAIIHSKDFLTHCGIEYKEAGHIHILRWSVEDKLYVCSLNPTDLG